MQNIVAVVGPTASGKTTLSIKLAKELNGEIVSCDSMQIYKYMDIGTAKPSLSEREGIPHHMIDIIEPNDSYSAADFVLNARKCIDDILKRGKLPVLAGGTGLYADSIINNIQFSDVPADEEYRAFLNDEAKKYGNEYLHEMLKDIDSLSYQKLHPNDIKRVIRALEIYRATKTPKSEHDVISMRSEPVYNALILGIETDRKLLYERIDKRVDIMLESGLLDEVKHILSLGVGRDATSMQAIGYKELAAFFSGECTLEGAVYKIKQESRRYAKRQLTWFRKNTEIKWIELEEYYKNITILIEYIKNVLHL